MKGHQFRLLMVVGVTIVSLAVLTVSRTSHSNLACSFLSYSNSPGGTLYAQINVINSGKRAISFTGMCVLRPNKTTNAINASYSAPKQHLRSSESAIIVVMLPDDFTNSTTATLYFSSLTAQTRLYDWQWGPGGPGPKLNKVVPNFFKGKVFDLMRSIELTPP